MRQDKAQIACSNYTYERFQPSEAFEVKLPQQFNILTLLTICRLRPAGGVVYYTHYSHFLLRFCVIRFGNDDKAENKQYIYFNQIKKSKNVFFWILRLIIH